MSGLGVPAALKPTLFRKFLDMLDEVTALRDEETGLISQIDAIELRHKLMRKQKKLKRAGPRAKIAAATFQIKEIQGAKAKGSFFDTLLLLVLWLIVLWNMFRLLPGLKMGLATPKRASRPLWSLDE
jgi:hypothetical protein